MAGGNFSYRLFCECRHDDLTASTNDAIEAAIDPIRCRVQRSGRGRGDKEDGKNKFKVFDSVQVFSKSGGVWCDGEVKLVDQEADTVTVEYKNSSGATTLKKLVTSSDDLETNMPPPAGSPWEMHKHKGRNYWWNRGAHSKQHPRTHNYMLHQAPYTFPHVHSRC